MELTEAEILALQNLARGPVGGQTPPLELAASQLSVVIPEVSLLPVTLSPTRRGVALQPGEPIGPGDLAETPAGELYLVTEPDEAQRALAVRLPAGHEPLSQRQRNLLRLAERWLPAWSTPSDSGDADLPPVGSAIWIDRAGEVVRSDEVAAGLLAKAGDLQAQLAGVFRDKVESEGSRRADRVVELPGRGFMRLRAEVHTPEDDTCLVALEILEPGSSAMFLAQTIGLSAREIQVARLVLEGWGNQGIGQKLKLSPATINMYLGQIYGKVGVKNRTELARFLTGATPPSSDPA